MSAILALVAVALVGPGDVPGKAAQAPAGTKRAVAAKSTAAATTATATAKREGPVVAFEIRDIRAGSLDWRGKFMLRLHPLARREGVAAWVADQADLIDLLAFLQADPKNSVTLAPRMTARLGDPARMTSAEAVKYVAALKRIADGVPNQATRLSFVPQVDSVDNGVRVNILSSRIAGSGPALEARIVIEENRLVALHTTSYGEMVGPKSDPAVAQASFLDRLNPVREPRAAALNAAIQVPEVDTRRIEGQWTIPADGALLVSLGPRSGPDKGLMKKSVEDHLIAISARLVPVETTSPARPSRSAPVPPGR